MFREEKERNLSDEGWISSKEFLGQSWAFYKLNILLWLGHWPCHQLVSEARMKSLGAGRRSRILAFRKRTEIITWNKTKPVSLDVFICHGDI